MELFNYYRSSASYRVRIALALKGVDSDYRSIHPTACWRHAGGAELECRDVAEPGRVWHCASRWWRFASSGHHRRVGVPRGLVGQARTTAWHHLRMQDVHPHVSMALQVLAVHSLRFHNGMRFCC